MEQGADKSKIDFGLVSRKAVRDEKRRDEKYEEQKEITCKPLANLVKKEKLIDKILASLDTQEDSNVP